MSYEGYTQHLCANGHEWETDCYEADSECCPVCKARVAWWNMVDQTNGSFGQVEIVGPDGEHMGWSDTEERIDGYVELEVDVPAEHCSCPTCGSTHVIGPARYKIPTSGRGHWVTA